MAFGAGAKLRPVDWNSCSLNELVKNVYKEHQSVSTREQAVIDDWLKRNEVSIIGKDIPRPIFSFEESAFNGIILLLNII